MSLTKEEYKDAIDKATTDGVIDESGKIPDIENIPAPKESEPDPAPVVEATPPVTPEPEAFPGANLLPEDTRKAITERMQQAESLRADLERANFEKKQLADRVGPTQQQNARLQAEHAQAVKKLKEIEARGVNAKTREQLEAYKAQFPDEGALLENLTLEQQRAREELQTQIEQQKAHIENMRQQFDGLNSERQKQQMVQQERAILSQAHPDWPDAVKSQEFQIWRDNLPEEDKAHYLPLLQSLKASDNIHVLNSFKRDLEFANVLRAQNATPTHVAPPARRADPTPDPDPVRRTTAPSSPAGQPNADPRSKEAFIETAEYLKRMRAEGKSLY
jgi:hypothetical protein